MFTRTIFTKLEEEALTLLPHLQEEALTLLPHLQEEALTLLPHLQEEALTLLPHLQEEALTLLPHLQEKALTLLPHLQEDGTIGRNTVMNQLGGAQSWSIDLQRSQPSPGNGMTLSSISSLNHLLSPASTSTFANATACAEPRNLPQRCTIKAAPMALQRQTQLSQLRPNRKEAPVTPSSQGPQSFIDPPQPAANYRAPEEEKDTTILAPCSVWRAVLGHSSSTSAAI
ncbi:hypothetical protein SKAU_G00292440 [Synaphobranchus kaupii]|uniref:Uncharacterized protein n=1 Tax=Synaphobranchus kaupii TaxID=118154 RepID=A0A9Q1EU13_SYNKA|nr:hypothetical protein SKAU_G00292440 [Synaphobranchus kaupii]